MSRTSRVLSAAAALSIVVGVVVVVTAPVTSFGWFAYAPLSGDTSVGPTGFSLPVVLGGRQLLGLLAIVVGLVLAGVAVDFQLGRRRSS